MRCRYPDIYLSSMKKEKWSRIQSTPDPEIQGGPSGRRALFADIEFKVLTQYKLLILKRNSSFNVNKRLTSTGRTTLYRVRPPPPPAQHPFCCAEEQQAAVNRGFHDDDGGEAGAAAAAAVHDFGRPAPPPHAAVAKIVRISVLRRCCCF